MFLKERTVFYEKKTLKNRSDSLEIKSIINKIVYRRAENKIEKISQNVEQKR